MTRLALVPILAALTLVRDGVRQRKGQESARQGVPGRSGGAGDRADATGQLPDAPGITYTGVKKDGPSTVATGYLADTIGPAHDAYVQAVTNASGYSVTKEEQDVADAEVNFTGAGNSGQVKLVQTCKDRTEVTITIRPA